MAAMRRQVTVFHMQAFPRCVRPSSLLLLACVALNCRPIPSPAPAAPLRYCWRVSRTALSVDSAAAYYAEVFGRLGFRPVRRSVDDTELTIIGGPHVFSNEVANAYYARVRLRPTADSTRFEVEAGIAAPRDKTLSPTDSADVMARSLSFCSSFGDPPRSRS